MMLRMLLSQIKKQVSGLYGVDPDSVTVDVCGDSVIASFTFKGYDITRVCMADRVIKEVRKIKYGNELMHLAIGAANECQDAINNLAVHELKFKEKEVKKDKKA